MPKASHLIVPLCVLFILVGCPAGDDDDNDTSGDDDVADDDTGDDDTGDDDTGDDDTTGDDDSADDDSADDDSADDDSPETGSIIGTTYWYHCDDPGNVTLAPGADVSAVDSDSATVATVSDNTSATYELVVPPDTYTIYGYWIGYEDTYTGVVVHIGDAVQQDIYFVECDQDTN